MKKKNVKFILLALVVIVIAAAAVWRVRERDEKADLYTGTIEATTVDVTPRVSGYIRELSLDEGMSVEKGSLAARIERKDLKAQTEQSEAAVRAAEAQCASARAADVLASRDLKRYRMLMDAQAISERQMDAAVSSADSAAAALRAAEENAESARKTAEVAQVNFADTDVYEPGSGLVISKNFEEGDYVSAGSAIASVANMDDCWARVYVPTEEIGRIRVGTAADIFIDGQDHPFSGKVKEIRDQAEYTPRQSISSRERANMVFAVKVSVDNSSRLFKPGMIADVRFHY